MGAPKKTWQIWDLEHIAPSGQKKDQQCRIGDKLARLGVRMFKFSPYNSICLKGDSYHYLISTCFLFSWSVDHNDCTTYSTHQSNNLTWILRFLIRRVSVLCKVCSMSWQLDYTLNRSLYVQIELDAVTGATASAHLAIQTSENQFFEVDRFFSSMIPFHRLYHHKVSLIPDAIFKDLRKCISCSLKQHTFVNLILQV